MQLTPRSKSFDKVKKKDIFIEREDHRTLMRKLYRGSVRIPFKIRRQLGLENGNIFIFHIVVGKSGRKYLVLDKLEIADVHEDLDGILP